MEDWGLLGEELGMIEDLGGIRTDIKEYGPIGAFSTKRSVAAVVILAALVFVGPTIAKSYFKVTPQEEYAWKHGQ